MRVVNNIAELIGETPLVRLNRLPDQQGADVYVKLEYFNPSRSVKDRAAYNMIIEAEKAGLLQPGDTIIEPTSGNTGIGIAMSAAARGYKTIIVMPDSSTIERINILKAYGATVVLTPSDLKMPGAIEKAEEIAADIPNSFIPMQFENEANPDIHRHTTGPEIIRAMESLNRKLTAFVCTAGTGGTVTGTGEYLKGHDHTITVHVAEPAGSPVLSGGKPGKHKLVGTSPGFIPSILNTSVYDEIFKIEDEDAYKTVRELAAREGLLLGPSGGASVYAAMQVAKRLTPDDTVVCIAPDNGERYLSSDLFDF
ncbi:cysteine synthase A [Sporosarcina luteola]|uniref:cysteine synthase A n=1 Tax=Sporosarcina luteola TaxID=582850 RepID=UPI00203AB9BD|nr:cysteine synthase A [Sporosarcina luteola]MCM3745247.1 cysteine synthase A [Sporosarcina luteola]